MLRFNDFYVCPLKYVVMSANSPFVTVHSAVFRHGSAFSRSDDKAQSESRKAATVDCGSRWPLWASLVRAFVEDSNLMLDWNTEDKTRQSSIAFITPEFAWVSGERFNPVRLFFFFGKEPYLPFHYVVYSLFIRDRITLVSGVCFNKTTLNLRFCRLSFLCNLYVD